MLAWIRRMRERLAAFIQPTTPSATPAPPIDDFGERVKKAQERPVLFWTLNILWTLFMVVTAIWASNRWDTAVTIFDIPAPLGQAVIAVQIFWIAASIRMLRVNEVAAIVLYGLPMIRVRRGPKFIIFGLFQLARFTSSVIQNQFPADPELIQKTPDEVPLETIEIPQADGSVVRKLKVRPIRITTAKPKEALGEDDILNVQMTVEFTFWTRWIVTDPFELIINTSGDISEVVRQMRDAGESLLNNEVTQMTPSELVAGFKDLRDKLLAAIKAAVESWGIEVIDAGLTAPDLNHQVAAALRDIPIAKARAKQTIIAAQAEKVRLAEEGKGRGKAREEEIAGEGRGYKRAGKFIGVTPEIVLQAQVARETVGEADLVLGTDGLVQAVGLGKKLLERNNPAQTAPTQGDEQQ